MYAIKIYIVVILLMLTGPDVYAFHFTDSDDITIHITATPSMGERYSFDIYKTKDKIKIVGSFQYRFQGEPIRTSKDSFLMDRKIFVSYDTLLNRINNTSVKELENEAANKNWFVLDGTRFGIKIISDLGTKKAYVNSPRQAGQPLLYQLIEQTSTIYRNNRSLKSTNVNDITIHIVILSTMSIWRKPLLIDIYTTNNNIKIVYTIDTLVDNGNKDTRNEFYKTSKDSILLNRKIVASYDDLLNRFTNASVTELENTEANKNRNFLDGVIFTFTLLSRSGSRNTSVNLPDATSHPLLFELLTKTFSIYRDKKNNNFLDKRKTYGY